MWPFNKRSLLNSGLLGVQQIVVPSSAVLRAHSHLREVGESGYEGFALWAGIRRSDNFFVSEAIIPYQMGHRSPEGVCVAVGADELYRINMWLYEHGLTLIAQLHSHPDEAYHSDTDDTFPIATTIGAVSLVVPHYGRDEFSIDTCAVYRLMPTKGWVPLPKAAASKLIVIVD